MAAEEAAATPDDDDDEEEEEAILRIFSLLSGRCCRTRKLREFPSSPTLKPMACREEFAEAVAAGDEGRTMEALLTPWACSTCRRLTSLPVNPSLSLSAWSNWL